jgi:predicted Holliday junction resolvase-like endonuclease
MMEFHIMQEASEAAARQAQQSVKREEAVRAREARAQEREEELRKMDHVFEEHRRQASVSSVSTYPGRYKEQYCPSPLVMHDFGIWHQVIRRVSLLIGYMTTN